MNDKVKALTAQLEAGVKELFESERYAQYLSAMSKFHDYSANNVMLIMMQMPYAERVAGYRTWQKLGRQVKKGERAISIIAPCSHKKSREVENDDGSVSEVESIYNTYRAVPVFDISQTDGNELPDIVTKLDGDVGEFDNLFARLKEIAPVPISIREVAGSSNGYYSHTDNEIVIKAGMSEMQTIKTAVHEITHSMLHCEAGECESASRLTREVQAESVAYVVCQTLGIDSSEYSFGYVASWSSGKDLKELTASLSVIQKTAARIIDAIKK